MTIDDTDPKKIRRKKDPASSARGAEAVKKRTGSQKKRLLVPFADAGANGLTAEEAGLITGMYQERIGFWKRVSDLKREGLIVKAGFTRESLAGVQVDVYVITEKGLDEVAKMLL